MWLECFPEKTSWCRIEQVCQGGLHVKRFDRFHTFTYCVPQGTVRSMLDAPVCTVRSMIDASARVKRHMDSTGKRIPRPKKCGRKKNSAEEHRVAAEITELLHVTKGKRYKGRPRLKQCTSSLLADSELLYVLSRVHPFHVFCYLVPSSRVRLLVITMIILPHVFRSLAESHSSVGVQFVTALMSSSQHALSCTATHSQHNRLFQTIFSSRDTSEI